MKKLADKNENEHDKFAPEVFDLLMEEFLKEQAQFKTKIVEMIATCSEQEAIDGLLKDFDLKSENSKNDAFDKNVQPDALSEVDEDKMERVEDIMETQESLEELIEELLEQRSKYGSIVTFFLATRKPIPSDVAQLRHIVEAYNSLESIDRQLCLAQL